MKSFNLSIFQSSNHTKGQSLIEILIALTIGGILVAGATGTVALMMKNNLENRSVQIAASLSRELADNVRTISESDWHKIYDLSKGSDFHYYVSSSTRQIVSGDELASVENRNFTRYFYVENVNRDSCGTGNITVNAATICSGWPGGAGDIAEDPSTQKITIIISWQGGGKISEVQYLTRSHNQVFRQTDWSGGPNQEGPITQVNNKFASSTNVDYTNTIGSIIISGL